MGYSEKKYNQIEKILLDLEMIKDNVYNIGVDVVVSYVTPAGKYKYEKSTLI